MSEEGQSKREAKSGETLTPYITKRTDEFSGAMSTKSRKTGWSKQELIESPERQMLRRDKQTSLLG